MQRPSALAVPLHRMASPNTHRWLVAEINTLGYAIIGISNQTKWRELAAILGFHIKELAEGALALRMDDHAQRLVLEPGDDDDLRAMGWEFSSDEELRTYVAELAGRGVAVEQCPPELARRRKVASLWRCAGFEGEVHEFYYGAKFDDEPFRSTALTEGGFVAGALGFGHILLRVQDLDGSIRFCREILGLRLSDRIIEQVTPEFAVDATFFHGRTGRHHSLAVAIMPGQRRIGHLMVEVESMNDVGKAYERCIAADVPIRAVLGRHPNDHMFSFYIDTPSGFAVEYGSGGIVVGDDWQTTTYDRLSSWGHRREAKAFPARR